MSSSYRCAERIIDLPRVRLDRLPPIPSNFFHLRKVFGILNVIILGINVVTFILVVLHEMSLKHRYTLFKFLMKGNLMGYFTPTH